MNNLFRVLLGLIACCGSISPRMASFTAGGANSDPRLDTNPMFSFWRGSEPISMESDALGKTEPKYRTEIRTRWTKLNLYFLFVCPYEELTLTPNPTCGMERCEFRMQPSTVARRPPMRDSFHFPERFGTLKLME
jgi:hypothetical protein